MNKALETMLTEAEGRYLSAEEIKEFNDYTASVPKRLAAMKAIERAEGEIVDEVIQSVWTQFPNFEKKHNYAREKCRRDVGLVLRYCAMSMLRQDSHFLSEKLLFWLRTILNSFEFGETIEWTYRTLMQSSEKHLKAEVYALLVPFLQQTYDVLTMKDERFN